jgi:restriction endonuclease Mrr
LVIPLLPEAHNNRGAQLLMKSPAEVNVRVLREFPEYLETRDRNQVNKTEEAQLTRHVPYDNSLPGLLAGAIK